MGQVVLEAGVEAGVEAGIISAVVVSHVHLAMVVVVGMEIPIQDNKSFLQFNKMQVMEEQVDHLVIRGQLVRMDFALVPLLAAMVAVRLAQVVVVQVATEVLGLKEIPFPVIQTLPGLRLELEMDR